MIYYFCHKCKKNFTYYELNFLMNLQLLGTVDYCNKKGYYMLTVSLIIGTKEIFSSYFFSFINLLTVN